MHSVRTFLGPLLLAALPSLLAGQQRFSEDVVVTGTAEPSPASESGRAVTVIALRDVDALAIHSVADALRLAPGLAVGARGVSGVQSDFSLRGAGFGQTLVLVDGVRMNDSQSGHHNGDIPVPLEDVERIEVLGGPGSSLYGADAFGGVIQILTRRNRPGASAHLAGGQDGFVDAGVGGRLVRGERQLALSLGGRRSDGFTDDDGHLVQDRDYRVLEGRVSASLSPSIRLSLGHVDKDFGASGFYGPAPSRESTRQSLLTVDSDFGLGRQTAARLRAYGRAHADHFIYDRTRPALSENRHESESLGMGLVLHRAISDRTRVSVGSDVGGDWLDSSNLGDRDYGHVSLFGEARGQLASVSLQPGLRFDAYGGFGSAWSPSLAMSVRGGAFKWRLSGGRAFRVPTFTELRYTDPNHQASPDLTPEKAWGTDAGVDLVGLGQWTGSLTVFGRWDDSVIDWVRATPTERWTTRNVRDVTTLGVETSGGRRFGAASEVLIRYAYLDTRAPSLDLLSKYVTDFARHAGGVTVRISLPAALRVASTSEYRRYSDGRDALLIDVRLSRAFGRWQVYAEGRNLLDDRYQEIRGVDLPGRGVAAGLATALRK